MSVLMKVVEDTQLKKNPPKFKIGCTVKVKYRIVEGDKERIQPFVGVVIRRQGGENNSRATFTVRKVVQGYGVERTFPLHSPRIESLEVTKVGTVRRAKLYYLRKRSGKAARIRERITLAPKS